MALICEHASNTFIFASTNSDQICLASSVVLCSFSSLAGISLLFKGNFVLRQVIWLTLPKQDNRRNRGSTNASSLQPVMPCLVPTCVT